MMGVETTYACHNCPQHVRWDTTADGWLHVDGEQSCGTGKGTTAAPTRYPRCGESQRVDAGGMASGMAICRRPAGGHDEHSANAVIYTPKDPGSDMSIKVLRPPLHWST